MDLKKLNLFKLGKTEREIQHQEELEAQSNKMRADKAHIIALAKSPGWALVEDYINKKNEILRDKLEKKDDPNVRAELKLNREFFGFLNTFIADI